MDGTDEDDVIRGFDDADSINGGKGNDKSKETIAGVWGNERATAIIRSGRGTSFTAF